MDSWWNSGNTGEEVPTEENEKKRLPVKKTSFFHVPTEENEKKRFSSLAKKPDDDDCDLCETGFGQCDHLPRCRGRVSSEWLHFPGQ